MQTEELIKTDQDRKWWRYKETEMANLGVLLYWDMPGVTSEAPGGEAATNRFYMTYVKDQDHARRLMEKYPEGLADHADTIEYRPSEPWAEPERHRNPVATADYA